MGHPFHSNVPRKFLFEVKKFWKSKFLGYTSQARNEDCDQTDLSDH